MAHSAVFGSC